MTQDEIDRAIILFYRSNNANQCVNYVRPGAWLDLLSGDGLLELQDTLEAVWRDVNDEIIRRTDLENAKANLAKRELVKP